MAKTVLIVEDSELNMKLFNDLLEAFGYRTVKTRDGRQALPLAREHTPDLIIMDIQLPEISGLEITDRLKKDAALKAIPVVAVTVFAMRGDEQKILPPAATPTSPSRFRSRRSSKPSASSSDKEAA